MEDGARALDCYRGDPEDGDWLSWVACADAFRIDVAALAAYVSLGEGVLDQRRRSATGYYLEFLADPWI